MTALLTVEDLTKRFRTRHGTVKAVDGVSFEVGRGETVALVGEFGCGKTTVALSLLRLIDPDGGRVLFEGADLSGAGKQSLAAAALHRLPKSLLLARSEDANPRDRRRAAGHSIRPVWQGAERACRAPSERGRPRIRAPERFPHEFSGGQRQRIAIARAIALEPKLLILDEPTAALDVSVQAQVLNLLQDLQKRLGLSYLFISHNLATVESVADKVLIMYLGRVVERGPVADVFAAPRHPYTQALLELGALDRSEPPWAPQAGDRRAAEHAQPTAGLRLRTALRAFRWRVPLEPAAARGRWCQQSACLPASIGVISMKLAEYAAYDALGLAELVERKHVTPRELSETARKAIDALNPEIKRRHRDL